MYLYKCSQLIKNKVIYIAIDWVLLNLGREGSCSRRTENKIQNKTADKDKSGAKQKQSNVQESDLQLDKSPHRSLEAKGLEGSNSLLLYKFLFNK